MALIKLSDYESSLPPAERPDLSGIACPECSDELQWAEKSLVCKYPAMQRLICDCGFSKMVAVAD